MSDVKRIGFGARSHARTLHIECSGCVVNIRQGLSDHNGRAVTSIEILSDGSDKSGDGGYWAIDGDPAQTAARVRVIQMMPPKEDES